MESRGRREKKARVDLSALDALEKAKSGVAKRSEQLQIKEAESLFREVDEEEYAKLVSKRRQDDFVEDDGEDLGYRDDGEEEWNRPESSEDEFEENAATAKKLGMVTDKRAVVEDKKATGVQKISMMLQRQGQTRIPKLEGDNGQSNVNAGTKRKSDTLPSKVSATALEDLLLSSGLSGPGGKKKESVGAFASARQPQPAKSRPAPAKVAGISPMDSKKRPSVPQRKKIQTGAEDLLRGPSRSAGEGENDMQEGDAEEFDGPGSEQLDFDDVAEPKAEDGKELDKKRGGGFARAEVQSDAKLRALAEQDDWKAMREAAIKEQAEDEPAPAASDETVKQAAGELQVPVEEDGTLNFFWFDAFEDNNKPGRIYLFGKIRTGEAKGKPTFSSCCVQVDGVERHAFILPRDKILDSEGKDTDISVNMIDHVLPEFMQIARSKGIKKHQCKPTSRKYMYHFEDPEIPAEAEYLKVVYSAEYPALPSDLAGRSFKRVFGTTQSCMELFLLKRDLMGPCWLNIKNVEAVSSPLSWCKTEVRVSNPKFIKKITDRPPDSPPLSVMSLHLQTVMNERERCNEIVMISALCHPEVSIESQTDNPEGKFFAFTAVRKLEGQAWPLDVQQKIEDLNSRDALAPKSIHPNERALLGFFLAKLHTIDPDVIVGHNFMGFDLDVLLHRMQRTKIPAWSKLGRLRRNNMPKLQTNAGGMGQSTWGEKMVMSGRLVCDTYIAAKENLRETTYTLAELSRTQLNRTRQEIDFQQVPEYFSRTSDLLKLISHNETDTYLAILLMFKMMVLPLTKQLTNLAGNLWSRSLLSARAERVEYLLLHEFHRLKYVMPEKAVFNSKKPIPVNADDMEDGEDNEDGPAPAAAAGGKQKWSKKKKAAYAGGLVLEPKRGLYDKHILLLDFNSLYPSIIQEYNICFTTVAPAKGGLDGEAPRFELPNKDGTTGVLPKVIKTLVDRRRQVKALIKSERDEVKRKQFDIRQTALKIMANSMYGCLGFTFSRFYAKPLAEMITAQGRELLQRTVDVTQNKMQLEVIYGDTDSIFINSGSDNFQDAQRIANETKKELNKMWRLLEVGLDGIYCPLLLLNKKKYAALSVSEKDGEYTKVKEKKGLDIVRRDWCKLARRVGDKILDFILSGDPVEEVVTNIHQYLRQTADDIQNSRIGLDEFVITKGLTKAPEEYSDGKTQPHVQVALKMKKQGTAVRAGEHVAYVICADDSVASYAQRAWSPADVEQADGKLSLDIKWYLESQLHPVVSRLCAVIQGTDSGQLAECLGLEASKFHRQDAASKNENQSAFAQQAHEVDRFASVEKLSAMCTDGLCRPFPGVFTKDGSGKWTVGLMCADAPGVKFNAKAIRLQVGSLVRRCLGRYHDGWLHCTDATCGHRTRNIMCSVHRDADQAEHGLMCPVSGCSGKLRLEYTSEQLYLQILYLNKLFDLKHAQRKIDEENRARTERGLAALLPPPLHKDLQTELEVLGSDMAGLLAQSAYNVIDLADLFNLCAPAQPAGAGEPMRF